ncbi:MAG: sigma-70 family RNA polymerase sigma factor [Candidatus Pacebacteria bacterium]|nr:sigma-70 family RNA polymerase sigma factor [Candidatus Paceibacterota bacterium]
MRNDSLIDLCIAKTDEELVAMALENQDYFAYIVERYEKKLLSYVIRISGLSREDAEDVLQDTFVKIYINLNSFDNKLKFSSWVYRITHNEVINNYRKKKARPEKAMDLDDEFLNNLASDMRTDGHADIQYLKENVEKVMEKMEPKYREVLVLRFWEDKDYNEISDILKKPMGTVATLLSRAKANFQKELESQNIKL